MYYHCVKGERIYCSWVRIASSCSFAGQCVVRYEKEFGKIDHHKPKEQGPRTIAPFGNGKVDA